MPLRGNKNKNAAAAAAGGAGDAASVIVADVDNQSVTTTRSYTSRLADKKRQQNVGGEKSVLAVIDELGGSQLNPLPDESANNLSGMKQSRDSLHNVLHQSGHITKPFGAGVGWRANVDAADEAERMQINVKHKEQDSYLVKGALNELVWHQTATRYEHFSRTARTLSVMSQRKRFCDSRLAYINRALYVHLITLITFSGYFERKVQGNRKYWTGAKVQFDVTDKNVDVETLRMMITWMYDGEVELTLGNIHKVQRAAERFDVRGLLMYCKAQMKKLMTSKNIVDVMMQAETSGNHNLWQVAAQRAGESFYQQVTSAHYLTWLLEKVIKLLSADSVVVRSEYDVFDAAVLWINHRRSERLAHAPRLMECVRWVYMSPEEMIAVKQADAELFRTTNIPKLMGFAKWHKDILERGVMWSKFVVPKCRLETITGAKAAALRSIASTSIRVKTPGSGGTGNAAIPTKLADDNPFLKKN